jgi:hypothetical protein
MQKRIGGLTILACLGLSACQDLHQSVDYDRHRLSGLRGTPSNSEVLIFEAKTTAQAPEDTPAGETIRMQWLEGWLEQRGMCQSGYEILERRHYTTMDANPYSYDLRYEIRCVAPAPESSR